MINDYPQKARWKITHRETIDDISEKFGVAIISRGVYLAPGKKLGPNEKKLWVFLMHLWLDFMVPQLTTCVLLGTCL